MQMRFKTGRFLEMARVLFAFYFMTSTCSVLATNDQEWRSVTINQQTKAYLDTLKNSFRNAPIGNEHLKRIIAYIDDVLISGAAIDPRGRGDQTDLTAILPLARSVRFYNDKAYSISRDSGNLLYFPPMPFVCTSPDTGQVLFNDLSVEELQQRGVMIRLEFCESVRKAGLQSVIREDHQGIVTGLIVQYIQNLQNEPAVLRYVTPDQFGSLQLLASEMFELAKQEWLRDTNSFQLVNSFSIAWSQYYRVQWEYAPEVFEPTIKFLANEADRAVDSLFQDIATGGLDPNNVDAESIGRSASRIISATNATNSGKSSFPRNADNEPPPSAQVQKNSAAMLLSQLYFTNDNPIKFILSGGSHVTPKAKIDFLQALLPIFVQYAEMRPANAASQQVQKLAEKLVGLTTLLDTQENKTESQTQPK